MTRTAESAPLPCARTVTRAPSCDGDAPDPLFSGGRRHAQFHPRGRAVPCLAAGADPRDPAARRGAGRLIAAAGAQADASDRFRPADRAASAPAQARRGGREIHGPAVSQHGGRRDPPGRDVHDRAGALHGVSRRVPRREPGLRPHPGRGRAGGLSELLLQGELDLAVMAQPEPFHERLEVLPLYRERFCIAFPTGHRLEQQNRVSISDVADETYLRRINCEYRDYLADRLQEHGLAVRAGFQSEREDWIQMMVAAGLGVCFLPEFSPTIPRVRTQPVSEPEVAREVSLVSMAGRRFSPAVLAFTRAIRAYDWSPAPSGWGQAGKLA